MKKSLRKNGILFLVLATLLCVVVGLAGVFTTNRVNAQTETTFVMLDEAEVRLNSPSGIRFKAKFSEDVKGEIETSEDKGFLIFPKAYLAKTVEIDGEDVTVLNAGDFHDNLFDYVNIPIDNGSIYADENDQGTFLCNGVIHSVKEENFDLDFAAIAYYEKDGAYVYASLGENYGRDIHYVLSKTYLNDAELRTDIEQIYEWLGSEDYPVTVDAEDLAVLKEQVEDGTTFEGVSFKFTEEVNYSDVTSMPENFGGTVKAENVTVSNEADMYALSAAVAEGETYQGVTFTLAKDLTIDFGTYQIPTAFEGTFDYNGNTLTLVNAGNKLPFAAEKTKDSDDEDITNNITSDKTSLLSVTEESVNRLYVGSNAGSEVVTVNETNFSGKAYKITAEKAAQYFYAKLNYTADEIKSLIENNEYTTVKFNIMVEASENLTNSDGSNNSSTTITRLNLFSKLGYTYTSRTITVNTWMSCSLPLEYFIELLEEDSSNFHTVASENTDVFCVLRTASSTTHSTESVYISDLIMTKEDLFTASSSSASDFYFGSTQGTFVEAGTSWTARDGSTMLSTQNNAIKITKPGSGKYFFVKLTTSVAQLEMLDAEKFDVKFTYLIDRNTGSGYVNSRTTKTTNGEATATNLTELPNPTTSVVNTYLNNDEKTGTVIKEVTTKYTLTDNVVYEQITTIDNYVTMFAKAGLDGGVTSLVWCEQTISLSDLIQAMLYGDTDDSTACMAYLITNGEWDIYISNITLVPKA